MAESLESVSNIERDRLLSPLRVTPASAVTSLTLSGVRPQFRARDHGSLVASNPLMLLDHPRVDLGGLVGDEPVRLEGDVETLDRRLRLWLRQEGASTHTRQALGAEVAHLARFVASLTMERNLTLEIVRANAASTCGGTAESPRGEIVAVAQPLHREPLDSGNATYRRALGDPGVCFRQCRKRAVVAWGESDEVSNRVERAIALMDTGQQGTPIAVLRAECASEVRAPKRPNEGFPSLAAQQCDGSAPVVLVSAPFAPLEYPSLGLSTIRETVAGPKPPIVYLTIPFAESVGFSFYEWTAAGRPRFQHLLGEWIFASALGTQRPSSQYLEDVVCEETLAWLADRHEKDEPARLVSFSSIAEVLDMIGRAESCIEAWASVLAAAPSRIVGFTSVFQQNAASLALARRIKQKRPEVVTVFGGANWEAEMGSALLRDYPFVDIAVSGEADVIFPKLVGRLLGGGDVSGLPGVRARSSGPTVGSLGSGNAPSPDMRRLPSPSFTDYFSQWRESALVNTVKPRLLFESSRGCWWGEKSHCTFCGLNGSTMAFRSKSANQVLDELSVLAQRYPGHEIAAVDNILSMDYFGSVFAELAEHPMDVSLFYEVKSNLTRAQVAQLRDAGVTQIQPGIESLSDHALRLMGKGVTSLQNIQLLKWCAERGIVPRWNILWGFPGETVEDYLEMRRMVPVLTHLPPPSGAGNIRLDRFSPNHFAAKRHGFTNVRAAKAYGYIYEGLEDEALDGIAYYFDYDYLEHRRPALDEAVRELWQELEVWRSENESSRLVHFGADDGLIVFDSRACEAEQVHVLEGEVRNVFAACSSVQKLAGLERRFGTVVARRAVDDLTRRHLLVRVGNNVLSPSMSGAVLSEERSLRRQGRSPSA